MILSERISYLNTIFELLKGTTSIVEKRVILNNVPDELKEDVNFILEILAGRYPFGYKYPEVFLRHDGDFVAIDDIDFKTIKDVLQWLLRPRAQGDLSEQNIKKHVAATWRYDWFLRPIVNRTLRLGIGKSVISADAANVMLAKKFDGTLKSSRTGYTITEKLDGNRCVAFYEDNRWNFVSRSGKQLFVDLDMSGMPTEFVYDGELISPLQTEMSKQIHHTVLYGYAPTNKFDSTMFNATSGLINRHTLEKALVYNVFDLQLDIPYQERRQILDSIKPLSSEVRILPKLMQMSKINEDTLTKLLDTIVTIGGEGLMINLNDAPYQHKRTDQLLKMKKYYTMDMEVKDFEWGNGKYEGQIGAIIVEAKLQNGDIVTCSVGSGLSDEQRFDWAINPEHILGKIVEIGYFSLSQSKEYVGTNIYSMRFPRLKRVRDDKTVTSEF